MQNNRISLTLFLMALLVGTGSMAQEMPTSSETEELEATNVTEDTLGSLSDFSAGVNQKKTVDFSPRTSLDSMENTPLPGIYETNMPGPQPMEESVSVNDPPSEQLKGRLTPEVFQEMAELERDKAYLALQIDKQNLQNALEKARAQYRQDRLDEIDKRENVIRNRIQWWQEQEKLRQEMEKERQEAEELKNQMEEAEALRAQQAAEAGNDMLEDGENDEEVLENPSAVVYTLMDVKGTRGQLVARVKNVETEEITSIKVGDSLKGEVVTAITSESVILDRNGTEYVIKFID